MLLASCAVGEIGKEECFFLKKRIGFWAPDQKSIRRAKLAARPLCVSWTTDGNLLAVGMQNGVITIRKQVSVIFALCAIA